MRTSWLTACVLILGVVASGCTATGSTTEDPSMSAKGDGIHEYRAVCTQKERHDGNEIVLSKWLDSRKMAKDLADYHSELKGKGHIVRIDERVKAKPAATPATPQ
jgi:hypothetical protein